MYPQMDKSLTYVSKAVFGNDEVARTSTNDLVDEAIQRNR